MPPRPTQQGGPARGTGRAGATGRGGRGATLPGPRVGFPAVGRGVHPAAGQRQGGLPAAHISTVGVKRPGFGTAGRKVSVQVNACLASIPKGIIYHYDTILPVDKRLPPRFTIQLIKQLQLRPEFHPAGAYDGKKNLFMPHRINLGDSNSSEFDVAMNGTHQPRDRPPPVYKIRVTKVAEINPEVLQRFVDGQQSQDESVLTALTALNVIIRMEPILQHPFNARSFFTNTERKAVGFGFELWRGYFQSVRPAIGRLLINVDLSTAMFVRPGPLNEVALEVIGRRPNEARMLSTQAGLPDRVRKQLERFFVNVRVSVAGAAAGSQPRTVSIQSLTREGADQVRFTMRDGSTTTVAEYFRRQSNRPLQYPGNICIKTGKGAIIPFERCTVIPGQIARKQVPPDVTRAMVEFSTKKPDERLARIKNGFSVLAYGQSEYVRNFGLQVDENTFPNAVDARVLPAPKLKYGAGSKQAIAIPRDGSWNMAEKKFVTPQTIKRWAVVVFESERRCPRDRVAGVIRDFIAGCNSVGMSVLETDPYHCYANGQGDIPGQLMAAGRACAKKNASTSKGGPDMLLVILPDGGNDIYRAVKHFGDVTQGVATQCLKASACTRAKIQYWANVCLKVNPKLGGINVVPDASTASFLLDPQNPTIVMGADVMHPSPGSDTPSFSALVGSVDGNAVKYIPRTRVQTSRQEIIADLHVMAKEILEKYTSYQQQVEKKPLAKPKRLLFFRDGVSEGQFRQVMEQEVAVLKEVCKELKINPKITFIVVGKRHHYRLFPRSAQEADRSGNCVAGTVLDQGITHPLEFDFYLQSHGGLLGTSRSAHYSVLYDDNQFSPDALQSVSYTLCHVYARSTRSVSIPAPVYYADIVCSRARNHYDPAGSTNLSDNASTVTTDNLQSYMADFKPLHSNMSNLMYFM